MGFLLPAFLVALGALAVPIAMHLRNRDRNKPFRFPSLVAEWGLDYFAAEGRHARRALDSLDGTADQAGPLG